MAEMLWVYHAEKMEHLREHDPRGMRRYLDTIGDEEVLIEWDRAAMASHAKQ